jgi:hypothetical protein
MCLLGSDYDCSRVYGGVHVPPYSASSHSRLARRRVASACFISSWACAYSISACQQRLSAWRPS